MWVQDRVCRVYVWLCAVCAWMCTACVVRAGVYKAYRSLHQVQYVQRGGGASALRALGWQLKPHRAELLADFGLDVRVSVQQSRRGP
jgi:hypothetical protein